MTPDTPPVRLPHLAAFVAELAMLVCLAVAGWALGDRVLASALLAGFLVVVATVVWGRWCAPRAARRLPQWPRWAVKISLASGMLALLVAAASSTWIVVGVGTWLLLVGTLRWDSDHSSATT